MRSQVFMDRGRKKSGLLSGSSPYAKALSYQSQHIKLPIGDGRKIIEPCIVTLMMRALHLNPGV